MQKNVWLLTEERPKPIVVEKILSWFCESRSFGFETTGVKILPIMDSAGRFTFKYRVTGFASDHIGDIYVVPVSGKSSFVDYLLFHRDERPSEDSLDDKPDMIIEETKTDDSESRNTGVYQRCSKFVFTEFFYPNVQKVMLYNLLVKQKAVPTRTSVFGTRMLLTMGVEILGKRLDSAVFVPFTSVEEMMALKNAMPDPGYGVPTKMTLEGDAVYISARLEKGGRLASDPSIGMTAMMAACLRSLGWNGRIVITKHGMPDQSSIGNKNKFNFIAHQHRIELEGLTLPAVELPEKYWVVEKEKEKTGTIFTHVIVENLTSGIPIYENHGGCERGYFQDVRSGQVEPVTVDKYTDRVKYKGGDKTAIVYIPDLVLMDVRRKEIINIEGKTYNHRHVGVVELANFDFFEREYIGKYYGDCQIVRGLVLAGTGSATEASRIPELYLYLEADGTVVLGENAPSLIREAVAKLTGLA